MTKIWIMMMAAAVWAPGQEATPPVTAAPKTAPKPAAKASPKTTVAAKKPAAKPVDPLAVPAGAKELEPGRYRLVDAKGQAWLYQRTPFGLIKMPETKEPAHAEPTPTDWTVKEESDSVTFERPNPFGGKSAWTKKKTDLTDVETAVWKRSQGASK